MTKDSLILIKHILESIKTIDDFSKGLTKDKFMNDDTVKYQFVEWSKIAATRDKLIHHYFGIDINTIWEILVKDLPP